MWIQPTDNISSEYAGREGHVNSCLIKPKQKAAHDITRSNTIKQHWGNWLAISHYSGIPKCSLLLSDINDLFATPKKRLNSCVQWGELQLGTDSTSNSHGIWVWGDIWFHQLLYFQHQVAGQWKQGSKTRKTYAAAEGGTIATTAKLSVCLPCQCWPHCNHNRDLGVMGVYCG